MDLTLNFINQNTNLKRASMNVTEKGTFRF